MGEGEHHDSGWAQRHGLRRRAIQPMPGRGNVVDAFFEARGQPGPPVFVIQGIEGSGKSALIGHLRALLRKRGGWRIGWDIDAAVALGDGLRGREQALAALELQIRWRSPRRRLFAAAGTPRLLLVRDELERRRAKAGEVTPGVEPFALSRWAARQLLRTAPVVLGGSVSVAPPPRGAPMKAIGWLRLRFGIGNAGTWARDHVAMLERRHYVVEHSQAMIAQLERSLTRAFAADLKAASTRRWRRLRRAVLFVATSPTGAQPEAGSWDVELADDLRDAEAPAMLVISYRTQRIWSQRVADDPEGERSGSLAASPSVEIHTLGPLGDDDRRRVLKRHGVPAAQRRRLADASQGHQGALDLLGLRFGGALDGTPDQARILGTLPARPAGGEVDDAWVRTFYEKMAPVIDEGLSDDLRRHARAAAALHMFDADLLHTVLGDAFDEEHFAELVGSGLVDGPWAREDLGMHNAYTVLPFMREVWWRDASTSGTARDWHERALLEHERRAAVADGRFPRGAQALRHRIALDPQAGRRELKEAFEEALRRRRWKEGESLLDVARACGGDDRLWRAETETMAGTKYLKEGEYRLAEACLREARALMSTIEVPEELRLRVTQSLASCLRLRGRLREADEELETLLPSAEKHPVAHFQATWTRSLVRKDRGRLGEAEQYASAALTLLERLPRDDWAWREAALALGLQDLSRKRAHLLRHRADILRRRGAYDASMAVIEEATHAYREDPEPEAEALLEVVRAHVLRTRGEWQEAERVAQAAYDALSAHDCSSRSLMMGTRCLAQARLAGADPSSARELLEALVSVDASDYPVSAAIGHFGLGELARLGGDADAARRHYIAAATPACEETRVFEHVYGQMGLVELHREQGAAREAIPLLDRVEDAISAEHPLLRFWHGLLAARAHGTGRVGYKARRALGRAESALKALRHRDRRHPLRATLADTTAELERRGSLRKLLLLLP